MTSVLLQICCIAVSLAQSFGALLQWELVGGDGVWIGNGRPALVWDGDHQRLLRLASDSSTWEFSLSTRSWRQLALSQVPPPRTDAVHGVATLQDGSRHFVISTGRNGPVNRNDVWMLNISQPSPQQWTEVAAEGDAPIERYGSNGGIADGDSVLLLTHGFSDTKRWSDSFTLDLNESPARWRRVRRQTPPYNPRQPHSRCLAAGAVLPLADTNGEAAAATEIQRSRDMPGTSGRGLGGTLKRELLFHGGCLNGGFAAGPCPSFDTWRMDWEGGLEDGDAQWERLDEGETGTEHITEARWQHRMAPIPGQRSVIVWGGSETSPQVSSHDVSDLEVLNVLNAKTGAWSRHAVPGGPPSRFVQLAAGAGSNGSVFAVVPSSGAVFRLSGSVADTPALSGAGNPTRYRWEPHGILMVIGWGVLLPLGAGIARYLKPWHPPLWFQLHRGIQCVGLLVATVGMAYGIQSVGGVPFIFAHSAIGFITMILGWLQVVNAMIRPHPGETLEQYSERMWLFCGWRWCCCFCTGEDSFKSFRPAWELLHKNSGRLALVLGYINISLGVFMGLLRRPLWISWYVWLAVVVLAVAVLEAMLALGMIAAGPPPAQAGHGGHHGASGDKPAAGGGEHIQVEMAGTTSKEPVAAVPPTSNGDDATEAS